jgi:hypothetical protein
MRTSMSTMADSGPGHLSERPPDMAQLPRSRTLLPPRDQRADDFAQAQRDQARVDECLRVYREEAAGRLMLAVLGRRRLAAE